MLKIGSFCVFSIILFVQSLSIGLPQVKDVLTIVIKDQYSGEVLPFSSIRICNDNYVSDAKGEVMIYKSYTSCTIIAHRIGYEVFQEVVHLDSKNNIVILMKEEAILLDHVIINSKKLKPLRVKDILDNVQLNFSKNHLPSNITGILNEQLYYSFGLEPILERFGKLGFTIKKGELSFEKSNTAYTYKNLNQSKLQSLESLFVKNPSATEQAIEERRVKRSDRVVNQDCSNQNKVNCYLSVFYQIDRNFLFNPVYNHRLRTQELDHFGFLNQLFFKIHKFELDGFSKVNERDCYKIKILHTSNSIPISIYGHAVKDLYASYGYIYVDPLSFAILKFEYGYKLIESKIKKDYYLEEVKSGNIFFENIITFNRFSGTWLPMTQFVQEKDRAVKMSNASEVYETGYLIKNITYSYD